MTRTDRRRFPILFAAIAALAHLGAVLASLFSTAEAQTEKTNFYLWRTTMTVGGGQRNTWIRRLKPNRADRSAPTLISGTRRGTRPTNIMSTATVITPWSLL